jgi:hypothetical protein
MDAVIGTIGFAAMVSVIGAIDIVIARYQYRSELLDF